MEKGIQIAVAKADIILCCVLRAAAIILLTLILLLSVLAIRAAFGYEYKEIDYDAPGVDITSEGPDNDVEIGGEQSADTNAHL